MIDGLMEYKQQKRITLALCALLSYAPIIFFVNIIFNFFVADGFIYDTLGIYIVLLVLLLFGLRAVIGHMKADMVLLVLFFLIAYIVTYVIHPENRMFMFTTLVDLIYNPLYSLFLFAIPGYLLVRSIKDYDLFYSYFIKTSTIVVLTSVAGYLILNATGQAVPYMPFSYNILLQTTFLIVVAFERKNLPYLLIGGIGVLFLVLGGARGAAVAFLMTMLVFTLFKNQVIYRKIILVFLMAILAIALIAYFDELIQFLTVIAERLNLSSRTLMRIQNDTFFDDNGRGRIQIIMESSYNVIGNGLFSDRYFSGSGQYAHNLWIELVVQHGLVFGPLIFAAICLIVLRGLFARNKEIRNLAIIFISVGFIKLFFSSSYIAAEPGFYVLLGLGVNAFAQYKRVGEEPKELDF